MSDDEPEIITMSIADIERTIAETLVRVLPPELATGIDSLVKAIVASIRVRALMLVVIALAS